MHYPRAVSGARAVSGGSLYCHRQEQETSRLLNLSCPPSPQDSSGFKTGKTWAKIGRIRCMRGRWFPACHTTQCFLAKWCIGKFVLSLADLAKKLVQFKQLNTILPNNIKKLFAAETRKYRNCDYPIEVPSLKGEGNGLKSDQKIEGITRVPSNLGCWACEILWREVKVYVWQLGRLGRHLEVVSLGGDMLMAPLCDTSASVYSHTQEDRGCRKRCQAKELCQVA